MISSNKKTLYTGIGLAILATFIWSGNFVVARDVNKDIPPIALNFYRWLLASLIILPFAWKKFLAEWLVIKQSAHYLFWISLMGISLFNTFVYIGAHHTSAINLALIGTTSSPILSVLFARIFLNEKIGPLKVAGMLLCITGILYLLCRGNFQNLLSFQFSEGDLWVLIAAFCFAVYNTMVKKKPHGISPISFLFTIFTLGTILALPAYLLEIKHHPSIGWSKELLFSIMYLGIGASVICFLIWNKAIHFLGAGRTALFGNLIPIFSSIEATLYLKEKINTPHFVSFSLVIVGLFLANIKVGKYS